MDHPDPTSLPSETRTIRGRPLHLLDSGLAPDAPEDDHRPVVVALHGLPTSSLEWVRTAELLAEDHRVIVPDLPGYGRSAPADDQHLRTLAGHVTDLLDEVLTERTRVHLAVHDIGGPIGLDWAIRHPDQLASLTILNTTTFLTRFVPPPPAALTVLLGADVTARFRDERAFLALMRWMLKRPTAKPAAEAHWQVYADDPRQWRALAETFEQYRHVRGYLRELNDGLATITCPVEILWGRRDPFCVPSSAVEYVRRLPAARLHVLDDVGHFVPQEAPEEVADRIRAAAARGR